VLSHSTQQSVFTFLAGGGRGTSTSIPLSSGLGRNPAFQGAGTGEAAQVTHAFVSGGLWGFPPLFYG